MGGGLRIHHKAHIPLDHSTYGSIEREIQKKRMREGETPLSLEFMVYGFGLMARVQGSRFRVPGSGFRVSGVGSRVSGFVFLVLRFRFSALRFRISYLERYRECLRRRDETVCR